MKRPALKVLPKELLKLSIEKYLDIIGHDKKLKKVSTPSLPEETKEHPARAPAPGVNATHSTRPWLIRNHRLQKMTSTVEKKVVVCLKICQKECQKICQK